MIYDANNGTKERRRSIAEKFVAAGIHVIMLGRLVTSPHSVVPLNGSKNLYAMTRR